MQKSNKSKVIQAVLCCLIWSTAIPVLKIIYTQMNLTSDDFYERIILAGIRFLLAGIILFIFYIVTKKEIPKVKKSLILSVIIFAIFNTTLQYMFFYTGVMNTVAVKSVLLDSLKPLLVVVLAHFFSTGDRITIKKSIGLLVGFCGIIVANLGKFTSGQFTFSASFEGEGMLFLASLASAIAVIYGKKIMQKIHYLHLNIYQFLIGSSILLSIGLIGYKQVSLQFTPLAIVLLIYSSLLSAVVFVQWYRLISKYTPSSITIFLFLIPVFGSIISSIVFIEESITISVLVSLILLTISIIFVNYDTEKTEQSKDITT